MRCTFVLVVIVASLIIVSPVEALDVCSLVSRTEMAAVIGEAISSTSPAGPDLDKDSGAQTWTCTYGMTKGVTVVSVAQFSSTDAARKFITLKNLRKELEELQVHVTEEKGIGDGAFVFTEEEGMAFSVLKGTRYFAVTVGGSRLAPGRLKASLRKIAVMLAAKL